MSRISKRVLSGPRRAILVLGFLFIVVSASRALAGDSAMSASEAKALTRDFQSAQREETKALDKKQRSDLKELEASQKQRLKEWDEKEREARRAFLKQTTKGELIRPYMKDFRTRRSALISGMSEEKQRLLTEQLAAREALKGDQELRQKQFQEFLLKQEHPPKSLWPQAPNH